MTIADPGGQANPLSSFEVYRATHARRTYLVVSTSAVRHGSDPPKLTQDFGSTPALDALADELTRAYEDAGRTPVPVTLRVHGFNVPRVAFEREVLVDADPTRYHRYPPTRTPTPSWTPESETFRPDDRFYIGYRWPSEGMLTGGSIRDTAVALGHSPAISVFLLVLPILSLLWAGCLQSALDRSVPWLGAATRPLVSAGHALAATIELHSPLLASALRVLFTPYLGACVAASLLGVGLLLLLLRLSTYLRDRYRALQYGVPDLGEFMRALEEKLYPRGVQIRLDVVGHSMGTLLLINAFRVMSDYFHGYSQRGPQDAGSTKPLEEAFSLGRGGTYQPGTLILCAADIPAVMATPDRNNYFLSALRRFRAVHVFSSDRDIILKWLSSLANWASEPRYDMSGRKLGNVFLVRTKRARLGRPDSRSDWTLWPVTRPVFGNYLLYPADPIVSQRYPAELHFHDCTRDPSVSGTERVGVVTTLIVLAVLGGLSLLFWHGLFRWLFAQVALFFGLGLIGRPLWPWLRDRGIWGGIAGLFAEWPTLTMFALFWMAWDPHAGYFMFGHEPRRRISRVLRDPTEYPPLDANGREIEELDGPIRYKVARVSV